MGLLRSVVDDHISVIVRDTCVENGLNISPVICKRGIGGSQLQVGDTVVDTAESDRLVNVVTIRQRRETELEKLIIRVLGTAVLRDGLYCQNVDGVRDTVTYRQIALICVREPVVDIRAVRVLIRLVDNDSPKCQLSGIDRIRISCQDLECGTRLPCRVRCTVQCEPRPPTIAFTLPVFCSMMTMED